MVTVKIFSPSQAVRLPVAEEAPTVKLPVTVAPFKLAVKAAGSVPERLSE